MFAALALLMFALIVLGLMASTPTGRTMTPANDDSRPLPTKRSPYKSVTVPGSQVHATKARLRREGHTIVSSAPTTGGYTLHYAPNTLFAGRPNGR